MDAKELQKEYSFSLKSVMLLEKTLSLKVPVNKGDEFEYDISLQVDGRPNVSECFNLMNVKVALKGNKETLGTIVLGCTFSIPNYQEYISFSNDKVSLPEDLIVLLNAVIIGTMRGVMFSEFRGTFLNSAYLPVLDPRKFIKGE